MSLSCPVTMIIFNRPEETEVVFNEIAKAKPKKLFIISDGPRFPEEEKKCLQCRSLVDTIDWDCSIERNYSLKNLGCKLRVSSGLDWVFSRCEQSIILEDDCLPDPSFFGYCEELLAHFHDDERVMMISGDNFQPETKNVNECSYYFSNFTHVWGWATWSRAWKNYDVNMSLWPTLRNTSWLSDFVDHPNSIKFWNELFDLVYDGKIDTWDYQLTFSSWVQRSLSIIPKYNLVSNIGFSKDATHTKDLDHRITNLRSSSLPLPLIHPSYMVRNIDADKYTSSVFYSVPKRGIYSKLKKYIKQIAPHSLKKNVAK